MNNSTINIGKYKLLILFVSILILTIILVALVPRKNQAIGYTSQSKTALFLNNYQTRFYLTFELVETPVYKPTVKFITLPSAIMMTKYAGTNEANYNQSLLQISETVIELTKLAK